MNEIESAVSVQDVRESIAVARSHGEKFFEQIIWQIENEVWHMLGHGSWDSMRAAEYGDMGVVVPRADRPELVSRMRAKGHTQQAIADTLGVGVGTVNRDLSEFPNGKSPETIIDSRGQERPATYKRTETTKEEFTEEVDGMTVDTRTGEIVDTPPTGLDGKEYIRPEPKPKHEPTPDVAMQKTAEEAALAVTRGLSSLSRFAHERQREVFLNDWWPRSLGAIMPSYIDLFTPETIRAVAAGLNQLANDMEAHDDY